MGRDLTGHEMLAEVGWRSEAQPDGELKRGRRIFDASGRDLGAMTVFEARAAIAEGSHWTRGHFEYVRIVDGEILTVTYKRGGDNEGVAFEGGWRFSDDGFDPPVPYMLDDAREHLHDSPAEAMRAADAWLKAVRP